MKNIIAASSVAALLLAPCAGSAKEVNPHWYDTQGLVVSNTGVYGSMNFGDLTSDYDPSTAPYSFIDKQFWVTVNDSSPRQWVEAGDTDGNTGSQEGVTGNQRGSFCATQFQNGGLPSYQELPIAYNFSGSHSMEISPDPSNTTGWEVWVDGVSQCLLPNTAQTAMRVEAGIESSDDGNSFINGTDIEFLEYLDSSGTYVAWPSASVLTPQVQTIWTSTFSTTGSNSPTLTFNYL